VSETLIPTNPLMPADSLSALLQADPKKLPAGLAGRSAEKSAKDFESVLLYRMLEEMKRTIPDSGLLETGTSEQVQDIFWYYLAQEVASQGGLGLWKEFHKQLGRLDEATPAQVPPEPPR